MRKAIPALILVCLILSACGQTRTFEGALFRTDTDKSAFGVDCSDEINKGKVNVDDVGYVCTVKTDGKTRLKDAEGRSLKPEDFSSGDLVRVTLSRAQTITESNRSFQAKEIVLLEAK